MILPATTTLTRTSYNTNLTGLPLLKVFLFTNFTTASVLPMTSSAGGATVGTAEIETAEVETAFTKNMA